MISPQELIERITAASDADDCIVVIKEKTEANLRWASSTLTTNGVMASREISVIAFVSVDGGMAAGSVSRSDVRSDEVQEVVRAAKAAALAAGPADDASDLATDITVGAWSDPHIATGPDAFVRIAPELGEMFRKAKADDIELFGYTEHSHSTTWVGSKRGLRLRHDQPAGRVEMTGKSHGRSRSTWEGRSTRDFSDVSIPEVDSQIRQRLEWQARTVEVPAGRHEAILPAGAVADLLTYAFWMMGAKEAHQGQSVYSKPGGGTRVGETFSPLPVQMFSDPAYPGLECSPFLAVPVSSEMASAFDNGLPSPRVNWFKDGALESLIQTRATSRLTGLPFTPPAGNMVAEVTGATGSIDDLVASTERGLLLNTLWYIRIVDPVSLLVTGLTRDGVYLVEGGEVTGAVTNFRWNESPVDLLQRISGVSASAITQPREWADWVERVAAPAMRFSDFNMSTVSQAS
jgi:predicted Zn-dependent protease